MDVKELFLKDALIIIGEPIKTFVSESKKGLRNAENLIPHLRNLIDDLALHLDWQINEDNVVCVRGVNFDYSFPIELLPEVLKRFTKNVKTEYKYKPENDQRHLKFCGWFKKIKTGTAYIETRDGKERARGVSVSNEYAGYMGLKYEEAAFIQFYKQITNERSKASSR